MDRGLDQFMESGLQFFPVDVKLSTDLLYRMLFVKVFVDKVTDLKDQLRIFSFHDRISLMAKVEP
jgi:hypothetical protein